MIVPRETPSFSQFEPVSTDEVMKLLAKVPSKTCQLDPIPTWLLKQLGDTLAPIVASLFNCSFQAGVFPASQKQAIVLPRLKKPTLDPTSLGSYRPISNLSSISKLLERAAAVRLVGHAESNALFPIHQSSYRRGHSTETAMLCVHNDIVHAMDTKQLVGLVLLDLSAAFDTVDHDTLLTVLQRRFGACDSALSWLESYLSDRTQCFHVNGVSSGPVTVNCGVPQGSVLGPIQFISYTEEVNTVFHGHKVRYHLYADDKQVYTSAPVEDVCLARGVLQDCISDVANWCPSRSLQLNPTKSELIWFGSRHLLKKVTVSDLTLQLDSGPVHPVGVVRDLGVMLDSELSMKQHVTKVASSCFYHLRRLKQIRRLVGQEVTAQLVSAFILSRLDYCNALLAGLPRATVEPLQRVQNAAARLVSNLRLRDHVTPALKQLHWLPVACRIKYKLCLLMHLIHTGQAPQYLVDCVQSVATTSRRHLRSAESAAYVKRTTRTKFGERGFSHSGPAAWNSLPPQLQAITDTNIFKRHLKSFLFSDSFS